MAERFAKFTMACFGLVLSCSQMVMMQGWQKDMSGCRQPWEHDQRHIIETESEGTNMGMLATDSAMIVCVGCVGCAVDSIDGMLSRWAHHDGCRTGGDEDEWKRAVTWRDSKLESVRREHDPMAVMASFRRSDSIWTVGCSCSHDTYVVIVISRVCKIGAHW